MDKKKTEAWVLDAARSAGVPIPTGEEPGEAPDFRFGSDAGFLGIEASEIMRPASSNYGIMPVEEESFHRDIITLAEEKYDGIPVYVGVYFANSFGIRRDKRLMARALNSFVN